MKARAIAALILFQSATALAAETVTFDGTWKEQGFLRLFSNDYIQRGRQLDVVSDGTVSLLWRPVEQSLRSVEVASWAWRVEEGVTPTDLTIKGGDDRNLSVYFVFVDEDRASALSKLNAHRILREDSARALIYVWGGEHETGAFLTSPYSPRLRTKVLRVDTTGAFRETVDLLQDFRAAFGTEPGALVGLAVSADSDDTDGRIIASIFDLELK